MNLPETGMLNFFNTVLISLLELTPDDAACSKDSLINQCKSVVFGGQRGDYDAVIAHCQYCGLIQIRREQVTISTLGHRFLSANREKYFEITEAQKQLIIEKIIFKGPWSLHAREIFRYFTANERTATYELSTVDSSLSTEEETVIHFFKHLGVLQEEGFVIKVNTRYSELVYSLTADSKAMAEHQLEKMLMENRKLGAKAENAVVEFEKERLKKLGKPALAELVRRISTINVAAGYDIESFDGTTDDITPNRFIEVKATTDSMIRFYWSNNERRVAKHKKEVYWIYMMKEFKEATPQETVPIMIQHPERNIKKNDCLTIKAQTFLIEEISDVRMTEHALEDLKWYKLA